MKNFTFLFLLALAFAGCSSDDAADVPDGMLRKVSVQPFAGPTYAKRYYYDGHKLDRIESSDGTREIYYYDGDLIVNIKSYDDTSLVEETQFWYDGSGRLEQQLHTDYKIDRHNRSVYTYNQDATVTENRFDFDTGSQETLYFTRQFFIAGGEVTQDVITFAGNNIVQTTTYMYDDKRVPEHGIIGFEKIRAFEPSTYKGIYHNIVGVEQSYSNSIDIGSYSLLWTYNDQGAPTGFMFDDQGTIIIDAGYIEYFYK